jgi:nicotinate-nucleotide adenylyltransferase
MPGVKPIALLGGSFDPPHRGHLQLLRAAGRMLGYGDLRLLVAADPYQKAGVTPAHHRLAMARLAAAAQVPEPSPDALALRIGVDAREIERHARAPGPTYTIDSLRELRAEVGPELPIAFVLGWDQWLRLPSWKDWQGLLDHAHLCVAPRPLAFGAVPAELAAWAEFRYASEHELRERPCGRICQLAGVDLPVSSSALRATLSQQAPADTFGDAAAWLEPAVLRYIVEHGLYQRA